MGGGNLITTWFAYTKSLACNKILAQLQIGNPRLYDHPYQSPQLQLWEPDEVEGFVILRTDPPVRRRRRKGRVLIIQPLLFLDSNRVQGR